MPRLRFSPYAWAKLLFLRDLGRTEVGGFGITPPDDLLLVQDIRLVRQRCSVAAVKFDDEAVADFFDEQVDAGRRPEQFARVWLHTHPADWADPSGTDEATFFRCFGGADWALMFILAQGGETYARLRFNVGPGGEVLLPVEQDFAQPFPAADHAAWEREYADNVVVETFTLAETGEARGTTVDDPQACEDDWWQFDDWDAFDEQATLLAEEGDSV